MGDKILVGLYGKARSGKDTAGKFLEDNFRLFRTAFAEDMKKYVNEIFGLNQPELLWYIKDENKEIIIPHLGKSYRELVQTFGTEIVRNIHKNTWIDIVNKKWEMIQNSENYHGMVITDIRLDSEAEFVKNKGGLMIAVSKDDVPENVGIKDHVTERGISPKNIDFTVTNNNTKQNLFQKLNSIMTGVYY